MNPSLELRARQRRQEFDTAARERYDPVTGVTAGVAEDDSGIPAVTASRPFATAIARCCNVSTTVQAQRHGARRGVHGPVTIV